MVHANLTQLFDQHEKDVYRFLVSRVACEATAADLTQETFLRLSQLPDLQAIKNIRAYLFRVAANLATDYVRKQMRWRTATGKEDDALQELPDPASQPDSVLLAKEELAIVLQAIQELPVACRKIFILNRYEGLTHQQIASRMNVCVSTVEKNMARALNHCRQRLNESA